ncbi:MAG: hypothetical protein ACLP2F_09830 [Steroidobacteraceae bacterium]
MVSGDGPATAGAGADLPGEFVGRPSSLYLEINTARQIRVGGDVFEIGSGAVTLD